MQSDALKDLWMSYGVATMNELQQAGTVGAHGLGVTVVHNASTPATAVSWMAVPNLAALGAVDAAFEASDEARGKEATMEMMNSFASMVDLATHHDRILLVTHYAGPGAGDAAGEGGENSGGE